MLVNYLYDLDTIADNHEAYLLDRRAANAPSRPTLLLTGGPQLAASR